MMNAILAQLDYQMILMALQTEIISEAHNDEDFKNFLSNKKYFVELPEELDGSEPFFDNLFKKYYPNIAYLCMDKILRSLSDVEDTSEFLSRYLPLAILCHYYSTSVSKLIISRTKTAAAEAESGTEGLFLQSFTEEGSGTISYGKLDSGGSSSNNKNTFGIDGSLCSIANALQQDFINGIWKK